MKLYRLALIPLFAILFAPSADSQIIGGDAAYLHGCYIDLGISECGVYGVDDFNVGTGAWHSLTYDLGFIVDAHKDGWTVAPAGKTDYCGDYFTPGTPEEGWAIQIGGTSLNNNLTGCTNFDVTGSITDYQDTGRAQLAVWEGTAFIGVHVVGIKQTTQFPDGAQYILTTVELCNLGVNNIEDLYYTRNVDPDNEQEWSGSYTTDNTIVANPPTDDYALSTALGKLYGCFLGIGAADPDARATFGGFSTHTHDPSNRWSGGAPFTTTKSATSTADEAISVTFKKDIDTGECVTIKYVYILDVDDLDAALAATSVSGAASVLLDSSTTLVQDDTFYYCKGDTLLLQALGGGPITTYHWTTTDGNISDTNTKDVYVWPDSMATYTMVGMDTCVNINARFTLVPIAAPDAFASNDTAICIGDSLDLSAWGTGGAGYYSYSWGPTAVKPMLTGDTNTVLFKPTSAGTYDIDIVVTDSLGCSGYEQITVVVNPLPNIAAPDEVICEGASITLNATGGVSYVWNADVTLSDRFIADPVATPTGVGPHVYTVTGTDANGCMNTVSLVVDVKATPTLTLASTNPYDNTPFNDTTFFYEGGSVGLLATTSGTIYQWWPIDGLTATNIPNPTAAPDKNTWYYFLVTDINGCQRLDSIFVMLVANDQFLPNAFTPNRDGVNDRFTLLGSPILDNFSVKIYNRWGQVVYENTDPYDFWENGWDGTINGKDAEMGVYVYVLTANVPGKAQEVFLQGNVTLIR